MPRSTNFYARTIRMAAITVGALAVSTALPNQAHAQNLLESLFNAIGGRSTSAPAPSPSRSDPGAWDFIDRVPEQAPSGGGATSYCVRLCDGRYFPLPRKAGSVTMSNAQICSAMCPAAKTAIFNGSVIERAVGDNGKPYSSIQNAFLYRDKTVDGCACKHDSAGMAALDAKDDPTLRRGDVVVTREGPMVFTGDERKDRAQSFVRPDDFRGLPQSVRHELATMKIARDASETASLPADVTPTSYESPRAIGYMPRAAPVEVTPVAEAFSSFSR